ncbi:MAG: hypothetical protein L0Y80_00905 [Ignavibacteriae bacterium]|nr:hypothetical protein [Ignavibacteriota bacterium]
MSDKELSYKLSLYVDGVLPDEEARALEQYIAKHPDAERELRELKAMKQLLAEKEQLKPDIGFWTRLSVELDHLKEEEHNLLPFPKRFVPAITALGVVSMVAVGVILFQEREQVMSFLSETTEGVQQVYEGNFLQGAITPLLGHLDKDNVLQFALFGTLQLDEESETSLRVDETTERGYTIEVGRPLKANAKASGELERNFAALTVEEFYNEIKPTVQQKEMIDSVLRLTQKQLVASVFMSENEALAIDPSLPKLGRVTVSGIAACLEQAQRVKFEKLLNAHNAPYTVVKTVAQSDAKRRVEQAFAKLQQTNQPEQFMIFTPDTLMLQKLEINLDSLRESMPRMAQRTRVNFERFAKQFGRTRNDQQVTVVGSHPMKVRTGDGFFSIEVGMQPEPPTDDVMQIVQPRRQRPNFFYFEQQIPGSNMEFHMVDSVPYTQERLDSMMYMMRVGRVKSYGPKLDSLMREMERKRAQNDELREQEPGF